MSARAPRPPAEQSVSDLLDLTQELRALSTTASHVVGSADDGARVVLLTRDAAQRKWGERWLRQAGLQVAIPTDPQSDDALSACRAADVALVDVGLKNRQGGHLYRQLLHDGKAKPSVFALCANSRELADAVAAGPFDAARKPFNWEFLARRVARAATLARLRSQLEASESALKEALQFADKTRQQLRSNESVEPVTGLPNKAKFVQILQRALRPTLTSGNQLAVFVIGLTRFRLVVEAMGQSVANEMLARVGRNLAECLGVLGGSGTSPEGVQSAVLSSFDQSRFGLMLIWPGDDETLDAVRKKLLEVLHQPIE
ncbi:MAG: diguanylate cyclase, partial [Pseudomonadota bacterium]